MQTSGVWFSSCERYYHSGRHSADNANRNSGTLRRKRRQLIRVASFVGMLQINFDVELFSQHASSGVTNCGSKFLRCINVTVPLIVPVSLGPFLNREEFLDCLNGSAR